jgi:hypothetical protein
LKRATVALAVVAALVWSFLLFGIGLDDLTAGDTKPGVIVALVLLVVLIVVLLIALTRLVRPLLRHRFARHL